MDPLIVIRFTIVDKIVLGIMIAVTMGVLITGTTGLIMICGSPEREEPMKKITTEKKVEEPIQRVEVSTDERKPTVTGVPDVIWDSPGYPQGVSFHKGV